VWGSLNLGSSSPGKHATGLWGTVAAYSAVLSVARCGVHLAFAVGKPRWAGGGLSKEILELLGLARAPYALQIILVRSCYVTPPAHSGCLALLGRARVASIPGRRLWAVWGIARMICWQPCPALP